MGLEPAIQRRLPTCKGVEHVEPLSLGIGRGYYPAC
jgi:hypothetical protein